MAPTKIRPELKKLFSPDVDPLREFRPNGPFGILVMAIVHPVGVEGEESFDFVLCTPEWLSSTELAGGAGIVLGRHFLFVREFDYQKLDNFIRSYCAACEGDTWSEVAQKLGRLGRWEFEDYRTSKS